jgi:DnaK suppressor protein
MNQLDEASVRASLLALKQDLLSLDDATRESRAPVELDQTRVGRLSRMDALQNQALAKATHDRRQAELRRIDAALARLEAGSYGFCASCDEEISTGRLINDPAVALCIDCAQARPGS